jgi:hypothetical protein
MLVVFSVLAQALSLKAGPFTLSAPSGLGSLGCARLLAVSGHYFRAPTDLRAAFETGTPFSPTPVNSKAIPWIVDLIKALRSTYGPGHADDVLVEMISIQFKGQGLHPDLRPHDRSLSARGAK